MARTNVVVVNTPVRATPTSQVCGLRAAEERSTRWTASSPTPTGVAVSSSCTEGRAQPENHPTAVSKARSAAGTRGEASVSWTARSAGRRPTAGACEVRTRAASPRGSAYRSPWHGTARPVPALLSPVRTSSQARPGKRERRAASSTRVVSVSRIGGVPLTARSGPAAAAGRGSATRSSEARTPLASVTREPLTSTAATAPATPTRVWVRRRVAPARRMIVARGHCGCRERSLSDGLEQRGDGVGGHVALQ